MFNQQPGGQLCSLQCKMFFTILAMNSNFAFAKFVAVILKIAIQYPKIEKKKKKTQVRLKCHQHLILCNSPIQDLKKKSNSGHRTLHVVQILNIGLHSFSVTDCLPVTQVASPITEIVKIFKKQD